MEEKFTAAYKRGLQKVEYMWEHLEGFPHITRNGEWLVNQNGHWTGGFWIGLLWLSYLESGDARMGEAARERTMRLRCRMTDNTTHDQGFIFGPSSVMGSGGADSGLEGGRLSGNLHCGHHYESAHSLDQR